MSGQVRPGARLYDGGQVRALRLGALPAMRQEAPWSEVLQAMQKTGPARGRKVTTGDVIAMVGCALMLVGLIWMAVNAYPFVVYKFDHPELTETQLQIRALSKFRWVETIPIALTVIGILTIAVGAHKKGSE